MAREREHCRGAGGVRPAGSRVADTERAVGLDVLEERAAIGAESGEHTDEPCLDSAIELLAWEVDEPRELVLEAELSVEIELTNRRRSGRNTRSDSRFVERASVCLGRGRSACKPCRVHGVPSSRSSET